MPYRTPMSAQHYGYHPRRVTAWESIDERINQRYGGIGGSQDPRYGNPNHYVHRYPNNSLTPWAPGHYSQGVV